MTQRRLRLRTRIELVLSVLTVLLLQWLLVPAPVYAASCGVTEPGACMDGAMYGMWYGVAQMLWLIDSMLLQLAYSLDQLRFWLIETAFASVYQALATALGPFVVPFATLALLGGLLLYILMPLIGHTKLMNVRHVLTWALLAPLVLTVVGQLISHVEQARVLFGDALVSEVRKVTPGDIFGVRATDMRAATPLYVAAANPCGTGALTRPGTASELLRMDDLAASLLWADAEDIHCPAHSDPRDLPDAWVLQHPDGPAFAAVGAVGEMDDAAMRQNAISSIQRGVTRLTLGIIPCILAVLEAFVQLLFGLALVVVWIGVPFALLFMFFDDSASSLVVLFRQALEILTASWRASVLLGLVFSALMSAAAMGNAGAYVGFSLGAIFLLLNVCKSATSLVLRGLGALGAAAAVTGLASLGMKSIGVAGSVATATAGVAGGAVSETAKTATTAAAAYRQTGSGRYTRAALLGRAAPRMAETMAALGIISDSEHVAGVRAGAESRRGMQAFNKRLQSDARSTTHDGVTMRERGEERAIQAQLSTVYQREPQRGLLSNWNAHDQRYHQYAYADGQLSITPPLLETELPAHSKTVDAGAANVPRLLREGYTIQRQLDGRVSYWQPTPQQAQRDQSAETPAQTTIVRGAKQPALSHGVQTSHRTPPAREHGARQPAPPRSVIHLEKREKKTND